MVGDAPERRPVGGGEFHEEVARFGGRKLDDDAPLRAGRGLRFARGHGRVGVADRDAARRVFGEFRHAAALREARRKRHSRRGFEVRVDERDFHRDGRVLREPVGRAARFHQTPARHEARGRDEEGRLFRHGASALKFKPFPMHVRAVGGGSEFPERERRARRARAVRVDGRNREFAVRDDGSRDRIEKVEVFPPRERDHARVRRKERPRDRTAFGCGPRTLQEREERFAVFQRHPPCGERARVDRQAQRLGREVFDRDARGRENAPVPDRHVAPHGPRNEIFRNRPVEVDEPVFARPQGAFGEKPSATVGDAQFEREPLGERFPVGRRNDRRKAHGFARAVETAVRKRQGREVFAARTPRRFEAREVREVFKVGERNPREVRRLSVGLALEKNRARALFALKPRRRIEARAPRSIGGRALQNRSVCGQKERRTFGGGSARVEFEREEVDRAVGVFFDDESRIRNEDGALRRRAGAALAVLLRHKARERHAIEARPFFGQEGREVDRTEPGFPGGVRRALRTERDRSRARVDRGVGSCGIRKRPRHVGRRREKGVAHAHDPIVDFVDRRGGEGERFGAREGEHVTGLQKVETTPGIGQRHGRGPRGAKPRRARRGKAFGESQHGVAARGRRKANAVLDGGRVGRVRGDDLQRRRALQDVVVQSGRRRPVRGRRGVVVQFFGKEFHFQRAHERFRRDVHRGRDEHFIEVVEVLVARA